MSKQVKTYGINSRVSFLRGRKSPVRVVGKVVDIRYTARGQYAVVEVKKGKDSYEHVLKRQSQLAGPRAA